MHLTSTVTSVQRHMHDKKNAYSMPQHARVQARDVMDIFCPCASCIMQALSSWLLSLLSAYTHQGLSAAVTAAAASRGCVPRDQQAQCCKLASLCVCLCLVLNQQLPLFQQLFSLFQQAAQQVESVIRGHPPGTDLSAQGKI